MKKVTNCENCAFYYYDAEEDCYCCEVSLDEDELCRFLSCSFDNCPYFQFFDEYKIAGKQ